jgi:hypothetical protein
MNIMRKRNSIEMHWGRFLLHIRKQKDRQEFVPLFSNKRKQKDRPLASLYQIARKCCKVRLAAIIPTQQQNPKTIGFPPDFTSFTMFVFKPIAAIARMIKNLLSSLNGVNTAAGTPKLVAIVVMIEANTK